MVAEGSTVLRIDPDRADAVLARAVELGVQIQAVSPVRQTLETLLLDEVDRAAPVNNKTLGVLP